LSFPSFAKAHGYEVVNSFYDAAVSGADPERPGFKTMMDRIAGNVPRSSVMAASLQRGRSLDER
jgi:DNA invertase Pin-like site-specific DNA recombinase